MKPIGSALIAAAAGLFVLFAVAHPALALNLNLGYPEFGGINLNEDQSLPQLIGWLYYAMIGISGLAAFAMLVAGGVQWMSSAGNTSALSAAKKRIENAAVGLLLVLTSYLIIQVVNPDLLQPNLPDIPKAVVVRDDAQEGAQEEPPVLAALEINGQTESITINLDTTNKILIEWSAENAQNQTPCRAFSPLGAWNGEVPSSGEKEVSVSSLRPNNRYSFSFTCIPDGGRIGDPGRIGMAVYTTGTPSASAEPTVRLSAEIVYTNTWGNLVRVSNGSYAPTNHLAIGKNNIDDLSFSWTAQNVDEFGCQAQGNLPRFLARPDPDKGGYRYEMRSVFPPAEKREQIKNESYTEYNLTLACTNSTSGKTASDTITLEIKRGWFGWW